MTQGERRGPPPPPPPVRRSVDAGPADDEAHTSLFQPGSGPLSFLPSAGAEALAPSLPPARLGGGALAQASTTAARDPIPTLSPTGAKPTPKEAVQSVLRNLPRRRARAAKQGTQTGIRAELERRLLSHLSRSLPPGEQLASVMSRAATLEDRSGQSAVSKALRESALQVAPRHPMVLRDLRRQELLAGDHEAARQVVARELDSPQSPTARRALRALMQELTTNASPAAPVPSDAGLPELIQTATADGARGNDLGCGLGLLQAAKRTQGSLRAGLATAAAQALLGSGDARAAQEACEVALAAGPEHIGIALLAARVAFLEHDYAATTKALTRLLRSSPNRTQSRAIRRLAAQVAFDHNHAPEDGKTILGSPESASEARLLLRCVSEQGLGSEVTRALWQWQRQAGEHRAAVPLCELGRRALAAGEDDKAQKLFEQVESLAPQAPEALGFLRDAQGRFIRASLARDAPEGDPAMAAARATLEGADTEEAVLLAELSTHLDDGASLALGHDVEMANRRTLRAAVLQWAQRLRGAQVLGPMLALHAFAEPSKTKLRLDSLAEQHGASPALWAALLSDLGIAGLTNVAALAPSAARSPLQVALARLRASEPTSPEANEPAAIARLQAQIQAQPDSSAASDLRVIGLLAGNGELVEQVEGLLAGRSQARVQTATHLLSAGTAVARTDAQKARLYLHRCAELMPADPVFALLGQRMEGTVTPDRSTAAERSAEPAKARESTLARAARDEFEGRLDAAAYHYAEIAQTPELEALAFSGRLRCKLRAGDHDGALALLDEHLSQAASSEAQMAALAAVLDAQPLASHVPELEASLAHARRHPAHVPVLRALERSASAHGRPDLLQEAAECLSRALSHRSDRTAYFKLWARMVDGTVESDVIERALQTRFRELEMGHPSLCLVAERVARDVGDQEMLVRSLRAQLEMAESDNERATLALALKRAFLDPIGAPNGSSQADLQAAIRDSIALLRPHVAAAPGHPTVAEELALLYLLAGKRKEAADTLVHAATAANAPARRVSFLFHAARLYEFLGETDHAEELLTRVVEADPDHSDAMQQLESLLRSHRRLPALASLYAQKIEREPDPQARLLLGLERHGFYLALGEAAVAEHLLEELLKDYEDPVGVLVATASSLRSQGRHRASASALIALAGRAEAPDLLRHAYFSLGEIYQDELSDMRRAEVAFSRCVRVDAGDREALDRLTQIYAVTDRPSKELRTLRRLLELPVSEADRERYQRRVQRLEATQG